MAGHLEERIKIPLFDGSNFDNWKFRMETLLEELELADLIDESYTAKIELAETDSAEAKEAELDKWRKKDRKCRLQIIQRIADSHLEYVKDAETAFEMWSNLHETFERKGVASQLLLRKTLLTLKFNPNSQSMEAHFLKFDKLIRELRSTGATLEETDIVCHLLLTMPNEYDIVVTALETLSAQNLTLSFVKNRLLEEESKRRSSKYKSKDGNQQSIAFVTSSGKNTVKTREKFRFKCYNCGIIGHKRSECKKPPRRDYSKSKDAEAAKATVSKACEEDHYCFPAIKESRKDKENRAWFLDSGASEHLTKTCRNLENVRALKTKIKIKSAKSGQFLIAEKIGDVKIKTVVAGCEIPIVIKDVLFVPGLELNLLSVRKLEINGLKIVFESGKGYISKGKKILATAVRNDKLYELELSEISAQVCCVKDNNAKLWHRRLGHMSIGNMRQLDKIASGINYNVKDLQDGICPICVEGKQSCLPHNKEHIKAKRPLQLVHSDLFGPISPESYNGNRYVLEFIDDFTHFSVVYILKNKTEVFKYFKIYEAMATAHSDKRISRFRCDNGREYLTNEIRDYFEKRGIQMECTIRYTPQQNGLAERMNRTIIEKARCMLLESKLEKSMWPEAVTTAVYLINRSPTRALIGKTPAELWYGEKPNLDKLKVFGSLAYLHLPKEINAGKFDSRTVKCIFVGYCPNGYRLWNPKENKIIYGSDIIFDESKNIQSIVEYEYDLLEDKNWQKEVSEENMEIITESQNFEEEEDQEIRKAEDMLEGDSIRRSERKKYLPRHFDDYVILALNAEHYVEDLPQTVQDVNKREDKDKWYKAIKEELTSLERNQTWTLAELPSGRKAIQNKWIFKIKRNEEGDIDRYKARLVIKGCSQRKNFDYTETYAPVARLTTVRMLLSIINEQKLFAVQLDVKNAFLHGTIDEEIYMVQPEGFVTKNPNLVCRLNKSLYGLKQAPRAWNNRFNTYMKNIGFVRSEYDMCLYIKSSHEFKLYLLLYVDDIILTSNSENELDLVRKMLSQEFEMTDMGILRSFLGIKIEVRPDGMFLSQKVYTKNLLKRFGMDTCNSTRTPLETNYMEIKEGEIIKEKNPIENLLVV